MIIALLILLVVQLPVEARLLSDESGGSLYLPLVMKNYPPPPPIFGVEINRGWVSKIVNKAVDGNIHWVRYNGIIWHEIEKSEGSYDTNALNAIKADLQLLNQYGLKVVLIVRGTPSYYQKVDGYDCGPVKQENFEDFKRFIQFIVNELKPYNVKNWEIGNEPDVHPSPAMKGAPYGCWGDINDPYYGGRYYGEFLKVAYQAIKEVDPSARVHFGGLLLVCDPEKEPSPNYCLAAKFLEGAMLGGAGNYFDVLAFHSYPYWMVNNSNQEYFYEWDRKHWYWSHRRGILLGKLDYVREILNRYGYPNKPISMNEGGLMCSIADRNSPNYTYCTDGKLFKAQGNYAIRTYARSLANNIESVMWYTLNGPGWREGGLLDGSGNPRLAYYSIKFLGGLLTGLESSRIIAWEDDFEGYEFIKTNKIYRVYWTNSSSSRSLPRPQGLSRVYQYDPNYQYSIREISIGSQISVGFDPVILEIDK
ncbi:MAG: hypothetical protein QXL34_07445 [Thermosphaera sp.]